MKMRGLEEQDLSEQTEYFIECEVCGNGSSCDGSSYLALRLAEKEGFKLNQDGVILCPDCWPEAL